MYSFCLSFAPIQDILNPVLSIDETMTESKLIGLRKKSDPFCLEEQMRGMHEFRALRKALIASFEKSNQR